MKADQKHAVSAGRGLTEIRRMALADAAPGNGVLRWCKARARETLTPMTTAYTDSQNPLKMRRLVRQRAQLAAWMPKELVTDEAAVLAVAQQRTAALLNRDADSLRGLLSPAFQYTNASGNAMNREEYIKTYVLDPKLVWFQQTLTGALVSVRGNTAILQGVVHDIARIGTHDLDATFRTYQTYERRDGRWLYVIGKNSRRYQEPPASAG